MKKLNRLIVAGVAMVFALSSHARVTSTNDPYFKSGTGVYGSYVHCLLVQPDDKVVIGGMFTMVGDTQKRNLARLLPTGAVDESFNTGAGPDNEILAVARQNDGKILIGGDFRNVAGVARRAIARLNPNGTIDTTFCPTNGLDGMVRAIAVQPDGKIMIAGFFTRAGGLNRNNIARLNADGTLDKAFNPGTGPYGGNLFALLVQADKRIITAGEFTSFSGSSRRGIVRLNENGSIDTNFVATTSGWIGYVRLLKDGKFMVGGDFNDMNGVKRDRIARLYPDGKLDTNFNVTITSSSYALVHQIAEDEDKSIIISGLFDRVNGTNLQHLVRVDSGGILDTNFAPRPSNPVRCMAWNSLGHLVIGGEFTAVAKKPQTRIAVLGTPSDSTYLPQGFSSFFTDRTGIYFTFRASPEANALVQCSSNLVDWMDCTNVPPGLAVRFSNYFGITNQLFYRIKGQ